MNVSRDVCFLSAEHDYRVFGNICSQVLDGPPRALGERRKGHSQESHDNKWEHFFHHISSFLLMTLEPLQDLSTGSLQTPYCAHRFMKRMYMGQRARSVPRNVPSRIEIGMHYPQQIQFCRHSQRNNGCKLTSNRRVQTDTGGYKKKHISLTQSIMVCET